MKKFVAEKFQANLLNWYRQNARLLPWRARDPRKANPYHVWLSEIMLQQTVVKTVIPYFENFTTKWRTVHDLAKAPEDQILKAWAGLGYYARARNLIKCARQIVEDHNGIFPDDETVLLKLGGVGAYTAAAIRAIAFNKPAIVVDGNIERIASRVFKVEEFLPAAKLTLKIKAAEFYKHDSSPAEMAQALMDLGATICIPKAPRCTQCPVSEFCKLNGQKEAGLYPRKQAKSERPERLGHAFIFYTKSGQIFVEKRAEKGMLGGMLGLPTSDWDKAGNVVDYNIKSTRKIGIVRHIFSHFTLHLTVKSKCITADEIKILKRKGQFVELSEIDKAGLPSVFLKAIKLFTAS